MSRFRDLILLTSVIVLHLGRSGLAVTNGDLRFAGIGASKYAGRLEIHYNGEWGSVCGGGSDSHMDSSFGLEAAQVACKQMGLGYAVDYYSALHLPEKRYQYGRGSGNIFLGNEVSCTSFHTHILECTYGYLGTEHTTDCDHTMDVVLQCSNITSPYHGQVRFAPETDAPATPTTSRSSGRVELFANDEWKKVCLSSEDTAAGNAICKQLGFTGMDRIESFPDQTSTNVWSLPSFSCGADSSCFKSCVNDQSPGTAGDPPCEAAVLYCKFMMNDLDYDRRDPREECQFIETSEKDIQLLPADAAIRRAEVYVDGEWGTICGIGFTALEAEVVCKQAGYPVFNEFGSISKFNGVAGGTGMVYNLKCTGLESHVSECTITLSEECTHHGHDLAIGCSPVLPPYGAVSLRGPSNGVGGASGTLIVYAGGADHKFQPICDMDFSQEHAQVMCKQLGYSYGRTLPKSYFGLDMSENTVAEMVTLNRSCTGSESHILSCGAGFSQANETKCRVGLDEVALECVSDDSVEFRLLGGDGDEEGRLQVSYGNNEWGRVCGEGFGMDEALVVCRHLDFESVLDFGTRAELDREYPVFLSNVSCSGLEENPLHCNVSLDPEVQCSSDVWITCGTSARESDGDLRLVGSMEGEESEDYTESAGLLEIKINNKWLSMCGFLFSEQGATVACRQLGYRVASNYCTDACFGEGGIDVYFAEDRCSGDESKLLDCGPERYNPRTCDRSTMVGLWCAEPFASTGHPNEVPTNSTHSTPMGFPQYAYYIIGGTVGGVLILVVVMVAICCCLRRWRKSHQGTWTSSYSQRNRSNQNGHSYHNGVVGDVSSLGKDKEKEGGFDDPNDTLEVGVYPPPISTHHDVILHALNHSHNEYTIAPMTKVKCQKSKNNGYHVNDGVGVVMANGTMDNEDSDLSPTSEHELPMCPPPDYNELFQSESATPIRYANGYRGNSRELCGGSDGENEKGCV